MQVLIKKKNVAKQHIDWHLGHVIGKENEKKEIENELEPKPKKVKLTFTTNANTSVIVLFTKESFDAHTPDDTISLTANQEKTITYNRESIYAFVFMKPSSITSAKIEGIILDYNRMFSGCSSLTTLDLSNFDTSNVMYMSRMFSDCFRLTTLDVSHFDTSNVTSMY